MCIGYRRNRSGSMRIARGRRRRSIWGVVCTRDKGTSMANTNAMRLWALLITPAGFASVKRRRSINRNAHNLCAQFLNLREHLVIKAHLISADGTPVGWIKNQDDWLPPKLAQSDGLIGRAF